MPNESHSQLPERSPLQLMAKAADLSEKVDTFFKFDKAQMALAAIALAEIRSEMDERMIAPEPISVLAQRAKFLPKIPKSPPSPRELTQSVSQQKREKKQRKRGQ